MALEGGFGPAPTRFPGAFRPRAAFKQQLAVARREPRRRRPSGKGGPQPRRALPDEQRRSVSTSIAQGDGLAPASARAVTAAAALVR